MIINSGLLFISPTNASQLAGAIRHSMPSMRDREVPYGTKGGEHNGHKEEGCKEDEKGSEEEITATSTLGSRTLRGRIAVPQLFWGVNLLDAIS